MKETGFCGKGVIAINWRVLVSRKSDYPDPIELKRGQQVTIGEIYEGNEKWKNWVFCTCCLTGKSGWVPEQIVEKTEVADQGTVLEEYSAAELDVSKGEILSCEKSLNGWLWCRNSDGIEGWVPFENLQGVCGD